MGCWFESSRAHVFAFVAVFLICFGLLQWIAAFGEMRGLSAVGSLYRAGVPLGFVIFVSGVYLALAEPLLSLLLWLLPAFLLAAALSMLVGMLTSWTMNPTRALMTPRAEDGYTATDVFIAVPEIGPDIRMPATYFAPADGPVRAGVLFVCGASDNRLAFKWRLIREMLSAGLAVLTIDPPGHGDFRSAPMTRANALKAGRAALAWLRAQPGIARLAVCGMSLGGCQAINLAADDPQVSAVALLCTPVRLDVVTRRTYIREIAALLLPRNLGLLREGSIVTLLREWLGLKRAWFGVSLYRLIEELDVLTAAARLGRRPLLIVHGTADAAVPVSNAQQIARATGGMAEVILVPQAAHISLVLFPDEMRRLAEWLAAQL